MWQSCEYFVVYFLHRGKKFILNWTDIFSDPRRQSSKHGNCATSSEQQDTQALREFLISETLVVHGHRKSHKKMDSALPFSCFLRKGKTIVLALPLALHTSPYHAAAITKFD